MKIIDMHCDTISCLLDNGGNLYENDLHIDIKRMKEYDGYVQFFAAFLSPEYVNQGKKRCFDIIDKFYREMKYREIKFCRTADEMDTALEEKKIAAFLSIEGADFVRSTEDIYELYEKGVRCMTLTWNHSNALASGVLDTSADYGLTMLGRDCVRTMNKCGIIVDVSHLSDKAFYDVVDVCDKPFISSHSNLRSVCANSRNLTDDQFRIICETGGGVGINLYPPFLNKNEKASIDDILYHIDKFIKLGGENHIGFGCDFDGVDFLPDKINSCSDLKSELLENLKSSIDKTVISKMFYANFDHILHEFF